MPLAVILLKLFVLRREQALTVGYDPATDSGSMRHMNYCVCHGEIHPRGNNKPIDLFRGGLTGYYTAWNNC